MSPRNTPAALNASRLVRVVAELSLPGKPLSHERFIERLGRFLNMADSIHLADALRTRETREVSGIAGDFAGIVERFLAARGERVAEILDSFCGDQPRIPLPQSEPDQSVIGAEAARRFYIAHQRRFELLLKPLHQQVRDGVAGLSPALARLAELDAMMEQTVTAQARRQLMQLPGIVGERLANAAPSANGDALEQFYREVERLLLAELDVRLLPTLGLIEAAQGRASMMQMSG